MTHLKKQIPALAGGLMLAGCGDGSAGDSQFLSDTLVNSIEAFCIAASQCESFGYSTEGCMAVYQAYISSLALVYGMDADCESAHVAFYNCDAETDCEAATGACDDERQDLNDICWPDSY